MTPCRHGGRAAVRLVIVLAAACTVTVAAVWYAVAHGDLIDPDRFARPADAVSVMDRAGHPLRYARVGDADRRWVTLGEVSPFLIAAVLAAEDRDFLRHRGVDPRAVVRSAARNLLPWHRRSGASTLTQQLVKLVYGRQPGVGPKVLEALRALSLERRFTKDEILEQYLNRVPFGDGIQGVGRASEAYLGHGPDTLTLAEAALLAGIPQAPSATEPRRHLPRALLRRSVILERMRSNGAITDAACEAARGAPVSITETPAHPNEAPRFVDAVLAGMRDGSVRATHGGITTSLDLDLQRQVESLVDAQVTRLGTHGVTNGAAVVVDNTTGEILAYVAAARQSAAGGAMDLLRARRAPGSSLKPFVYELLFEHGGTAATVLDDISVPRRGARGVTFEARDYDGQERGPVRARVALSASLNLAALDAAGRVGPDRLVRRFRALGFSLADDPARYGAAVVLGGAEVSALELAGAWTALARGGSTIPLTLTPPRVPPRGHPVMDPGAAAVTWDVLSDSAARRDAFGSDLLPSAHDQPFALKTGTSTGWRDAWASVADARYTVVTWLGDPGGNPMAGVSGFDASAPVAARILGLARVRGQPPAPVAVEGARAGGAAAVRLLDADVCAWSGLRAGPRCTRVVHERFAPGTLPTARCEAHDVHGAYTLPPRFATWAARTHPAGVSDVAARPDPGVPTVVDPADGARWLLDPGQAAPTVALRAWFHGSPAVDVTWEVDGRPVPDGRWVATLGHHTVVARRGTMASPPSGFTVVLAR